MIKQVTLPQFYSTMQEATIVKIFKRESDVVMKGDVVMEITTDKSAIEIESPNNGIIKLIPISKGNDVNVGKVLFVIETGDAPGGDNDIHKSRYNP